MPFLSTHYAVSGLPTSTEILWHQSSDILRSPPFSPLLTASRPVELSSKWQRYVLDHTRLDSSFSFESENTTTCFLTFALTAHAPALRTASPKGWWLGLSATAPHVLFKLLSTRWPLNLDHLDSDQVPSLCLKLLPILIQKNLSLPSRRQPVNTHPFAWCSTVLGTLKYWPGAVVVTVSNRFMVYQWDRQ